MKNLAINVLAFMIMFGTLLLFSWGSFEMTESLKFLKSEPISLEYNNLIEYSLQTFLRMFFAMMISIVFTLAYGTLAAKNRYAEQILIPLLDILQSVPILGFISFTITFFLSLSLTSTCLVTFLYLFLSVIQLLVTLNYLLLPPIFFQSVSHSFVTLNVILF